MVEWPSLGRYLPVSRAHVLLFAWLLISVCILFFCSHPLENMARASSSTFPTSALCSPSFIQPQRRPLAFSWYLHCFVRLQPAETLLATGYSLDLPSSAVLFSPH